MIPVSSFRLARFLVLVCALCVGELVGVLFPDTWLAAPLARIIWVGLVAAVQLGIGEAFVGGGTRGFHALNDLSRRLSHPLDLQSILDAGLSHAVQLLEAHAGCLRLFDRGELVLASSFNVDPRYAADFQRITPEDEETQAVLSKAEPVILPAVPLSSEVAGLRTDRPAQYVALVPLVSRGTVHGLITLVCKRKHFSRNDLETLRAIGTQIGIALANEQVYDGLLRESRTDPLTGLGSRRHFEDQYRREVARARRIHRPISLAMIDVDQFKQINDQWGHVTGDRVLEAVGELLGTLRAGDVVARYGGDEFVILMPETTLEQAQKVIGRVRDRLKRLNEERLFPFPLYLSIGVRQMATPDSDLIAEADAAMYEDKQGLRRAEEGSDRNGLPLRLQPRRSES